MNAFTQPLELESSYSEDHVQTTVLLRNTQFTLEPSTTYLESIDPHYNNHLNTIKSPEKHTPIQIQEFRKALQNMITAPFANTMDSLSSYPIPDEQPTLERFVKCKKYNLRQDPHDNSKDPEIYIRNDDDGPILSWAPAPLPEQYHDLPKTDVSEIRVRECSPESCWPYKTEVNGEATFFKPLFDFKEPEFWRELDALGRNYRAGGIDRLAGLRGIATVDASPTAVGLLTTWIDGTKLCNTAPKDRQAYSEKWSDQVLSTLRKLHKSDIIWGDVNAHNVLIDRQNDAWIIDLDGGSRPDHQLQPSEANKDAERDAVREMFATLKQLLPEESQWLGPFGPAY
ncbi:hypothetical protein D0869_02817 [Hortaea werneckii]|uniref:Protein kinase domain-containing protein n=1 Tax=Hortaea werneckii TaxID=91943 RepID=A0A3M7AYV7_HORWE|nr:hypothetical protein D0869_02817 [Hortaea werneckii]RMY15077.1 hypothetical protein D0868_01079 [Hortaea werneckii]RMY18223.1 hypothetical protein D0867_05478 [Hortaea werneckii]RMY32410.1 hypothetical protein D0866_06628 [Hortaea werneckii]